MGVKEGCWYCPGPGLQKMGTAWTGNSRPIIFCWTKWDFTWHVLSNSYIYLYDKSRISKTYSTKSKAVWTTCPVHQTKHWRVFKFVWSVGYFVQHGIPLYPFSENLVWRWIPIKYWSEKPFSRLSKTYLVGQKYILTHVLYVLF